MAMLMRKPFGIGEPIWMSDRGYREEEEVPPYSSMISYRNYDDPEQLSFTRYPDLLPPTTFGRFQEPPSPSPLLPMFSNYPRMFLEPPRLLPRHHHHLDDDLPKVNRFPEFVEQPPRSRRSTSQPPQKVHPEVELRVPMSSSSSEEKIRNELMKAEGVTHVVCDRQSQKVTVTGKVDPEALLKRAKKVQKKAEFFSPKIYSQNFIDFIQSKTAPPPQEPEAEIFSSFQRHQSSPRMKIDTHDPYYDTLERSASFSSRDSSGYDAASHYNGGEQAGSSSSSLYGRQQPPPFYFGRNTYDHNIDDEREREASSYSRYMPIAYREMDSHLHDSFPSRPSSYRQHHGEEFYEGRGDYHSPAYELNQGTSYRRYDPSSYDEISYYDDSHHYQNSERSSVYAKNYISGSDWESRNYYPHHNANSSSRPAVIGDSGITNPNYMQHVITDY